MPRGLTRERQANWILVSLKNAESNPLHACAKRPPRIRPCSLIAPSYRLPQGLNSRIHRPIRLVGDPFPENSGSFGQKASPGGDNQGQRLVTPCAPFQHLSVQSGQPLHVRLNTGLPRAVSREQSTGTQKDFQSISPFYSNGFGHVPVA
jgi:hypothetical protein